ncbi:MAG: hypothetical protein K6E19_02025, partial [Lachnospiraceae bacterium]|nr:hypothetical protein [Lachnospiraceae bacterium]
MKNCIESFSKGVKRTLAHLLAVALVLSAFSLNTVKVHAATPELKVKVDYHRSNPWLEMRANYPMYQMTENDMEVNDSSVKASFNYRESYWLKSSTPDSLNKSDNIVLDNHPFFDENYYYSFIMCLDTEDKFTLETVAIVSDSGPTTYWKCIEVKDDGKKAWFQGFTMKPKSYDVFPASDITVSNEAGGSAPVSTAHVYVPDTDETSAEIKKIRDIEQEKLKSEGKNVSESAENTAKVAIKSENSIPKDAAKIGNVINNDEHLKKAEDEGKIVKD